MATTWGWVRAGLEPLRSFLDRVSREVDLVPGTAYVVLVAPGSGLAVATLVSVDAWVEGAHMPGEAMAQAFCYAVVEEPSGRHRSVPRSEVLWPVADHQAVEDATRTLGLPLLPTSLRGGPTWRLGGVRRGGARLGLGDMVALGQLVAVP